jgi:hypothetical protein
MVPAARFLELLADIEPSPTTKDRASSAHVAIRAHLEDHETFSDRWVGSFLSGSYARDTSIRPTASSDGKERPDVDIIVITNFADDDSPDAVLKQLPIGGRCGLRFVTDLAHEFIDRSCSPSHNCLIAAPTARKICVQ